MSDHVHQGQVDGGQHDGRDICCVYPNPLDCLHNLVVVTYRLDIREQGLQYLPVRKSPGQAAVIGVLHEY